ncbi:hypothetical protein BH24ACT25_BH24ACT25_09670 [soil metagenome]
MRNRPLLQLGLIGVVASIAGVALGLLIDWFPEQASEEAGPIDTLYDVLVVASVPIFVLVMTVAIYSVIKFRARPGDTRDGAPIHGNAKLEVAWVTIPFLLVTALAIYAWVVLVDIEEPQPDAMIVEVTGEQFAWSFAYPGEEGEPPVRTTDLMLPLDRQVEFNINSEDVIHSFWVPAFRLKSDTVPGITTTIRVTPSEEGSFDVVCAELCGLGHSTMRQSLTVVPEDDFTAWLTEQQDALAAEGGAAEAPEGQSPSGLAGQASDAAAEPEEPAPAPSGGDGGTSGGSGTTGGAAPGGGGSSDQLDCFCGEQGAPSGGGSQGSQDGSQGGSGDQPAGGSSGGGGSGGG